MSEKFANPVLVIVDHVGNETEGFTLTEPSKHLLKVARTLTDSDVWALALNPSPQMGALGECGVSKVFVPDLAGRSPRVSAVVAECAIAATEIQPPAPISAILCLSNYRGREVASILGAHFESGAATDVTALAVKDGQLVAHKSVLGGQWETTFTIPRGLPIAAVRPGAGQAPEVKPVATPGVVPLNVRFSSVTDAISVISSEELHAEGPTLTEAAVVVCAGYGTDGDLDAVNDLAEKLGAAVGATRTVCDEGWLPRTAQIGQTGVSVAPKLYISAGVSGAVHHTCGIAGAERIVAIVDDEEAPIVQIADLSIIGDLQEIIPAALAELG
ncbi:electron transporter [Boudabousia tangfeifanii]|uniref:Electron transporter n=1 Tax=Boudabousia tangfeifanii TaxID=1912795 RepID=A0A1D9MJK3_9ACTO|nr:electron transfer flavoprotein subunit alpha/FixB family protein [Boudabousia tangfeifanii]AOZ72521.1 electron transporter [Boudabousia tangfeifanii]